MNKVYVVTYWDSGEEPVVCVFDNKDAANKYFEYTKDKHNGACLDRCPVYKAFQRNSEV